jgi:RNA polymerase sigma-70 factor (ECF subfamily)
MRREDERLLRERWLAPARARWPDIPLDPDVFFVHVARHSERGEPQPSHAADLYLACACANRVPKALEEFDRLLRDDVAHAVRRIDASPAFAEEVTQVLREKLLVGDPPKVAEYAARSSLRTWVGTSAARTALNLRRNAGDKAHRTLDSRVRRIADDADGEAAYLKRRYGAEFEAALTTALERLDASHRAILRLHFSERMPLDRLAARYGTSRTTMARRVAAARRAILEDVSALLKAKLRLSDTELRSLAAFVMSAMDVSVTRLLASRS